MLPVSGGATDDGLVGLEDSGVSQIAGHGDVLLVRLFVFVRRKRGVELFVRGGGGMNRVELLLLFGGRGDGGTDCCTREEGDVFVCCCGRCC
jgi:hypothetical protein